MSDAVLALNAGSSSIKLTLFRLPGPEPLLTGGVEAIGGEAPRLALREPAGVPVEEAVLPPATRHEDALSALLDRIEERAGALRLAAAGHRVVHGGGEFRAPVRVDAATMRRLERLVPLAPLHQPHNLAGIRRLAALRPGLVQVACFDTAFHGTQPAVATAFALPRALSAEGIRRYGFHGLSYEYVAGVLPAHLGPLAEGRVVVAHLGHGASMCAMRERRSVATTMGFTALDGLVMGRRCGALDPGVLLYLMATAGMGHESLSDLLYRRSGLLGVSGISDDMRTLLASAAPEAAEAVALFVYRIGRELGSLAAALGGLDALVFTGGIGENAAAIRAAVCRDAAWLGLRLDEAANEAGRTRISEADSPVSAWIIPTDEDLVIARHTVALLRESGGPADRPGD